MDTSISVATLPFSFPLYSRFVRKMAYGTYFAEQYRSILGSTCGAKLVHFPRRVRCGSFRYCFQIHLKPKIGNNEPVVENDSVAAQRLFCQSQLQKEIR
jgi:hypothetical protein